MGPARDPGGVDRRDQPGAVAEPDRRGFTLRQRSTATGSRLIRGEPTKVADETVRGRRVDLHRRPDLLDSPPFEHDDPVGEGHRLDLVVGDEDGRGAKPLVSWASSSRVRMRSARVEVRQRLVEQEELRLLDDRAGNGDGAGAGRPKAGRACDRAIPRSRASFAAACRPAFDSRPRPSRHCAGRRPCSRGRSYADRGA